MLSSINSHQHHHQRTSSKNRIPNPDDNDKSRRFSIFNSIRGGRSKMFDDEMRPLFGGNNGLKSTRNAPSRHRSSSSKSKGFHVHFPATMVYNIMAIFLLLPVLIFVWKESHLTSPETHSHSNNSNNTGLRRSPSQQGAAWMEESLQQQAAAVKAAAAEEAAIGQMLREDEEENIPDSSSKKGEIEDMLDSSGIHPDSPGYHDGDLAADTPEMNAATEELGKGATHNETSTIIAMEQQPKSLSLDSKGDELLPMPDDPSVANDLDEERTKELPADQLQEQDSAGEASSEEKNSIVELDPAMKPEGDVDEKTVSLELNELEAQVLGVPPMKKPLTEDPT